MAELAKAEVPVETPKLKYQRQANECIIANIGGDKNHGWGMKDSSGSIDSLIADNVEDIIKAKGLPAELLTEIEQFINPSQLRQKLENAKPPLLNKTAKREKHERRFDGLTE